MRSSDKPSISEPFIAWSYAQELMAPSALFRQSCEKHLRKTMADLAPIVGSSEFEGIIVCDTYARGFAVADMLGEEGRSLPARAGGATCDEHFDEVALCGKTNDYYVLGRMHEGSRGILLTLRQDESRRLMLLDQRQVNMLVPTVNKENPEDRLAVVGLLAHEMAHAGDYAQGRPGRPSAAEVSSQCKAHHVDAIAAISDMALAEYIATRMECQAQVSLQGACSSKLTERIETMPRRDLEIPPLDARELPEGYDPEQRKFDLAHVGNVIGTLAAYAAEDAPVLGKGGTLLPDRTSKRVHRNTSGRATLKTCLGHMGPALAAAASAPGEGTRKALAKAVEAGLVAARSSKRDRVSTNKAARDDWFDVR